MWGGGIQHPHTQAPDTEVTKQVWVLLLVLKEKKKKGKQRKIWHRREESHVTTEAEFGVMWPQVKECWQPSAAERGKKCILS